MAFIEERKGKSGTTYRVEYWRDGKRRRSPAFTTREEAERFLTSVELDRARSVLRKGSDRQPEILTGIRSVARDVHRLMERGTPTFTVAEFLREVIDSKERPPTTRDTYEKVLKKIAPMRLGKLQVGKVTVQDVWQFNRDLRQNRASVISVLHVTFNAAVRAGLITVNPLKLADLKRPSSRRTNVRFYSGDEVEALVRGAVDGVGRNGKGNAVRNALVIRLGANCGLRPEEIAGLKVEDLDVKACRLHVQRAVTRSKGGRHVGGTKSAAGDRRIAIPCTLARELGEYVHLNRSADGFIFHSNQGGLLAEDRIGEIAQTASRKAKILRPDGTPMTGHDLRHACASLLISQGWPLTVIQRYLGHSSIRVTSDTYGHLMPDAFDQLAAGMEALRAPDVPELPVGEGAS